MFKYLLRFFKDQFSVLGNQIGALGPGGAIYVGNDGAAHPPTGAGTLAQFDAMLKSNQDVPLFERNMYLGVEILNRILRANKKFITGKRWDLNRIEFAFEGGKASSLRFGGPIEPDDITSPSPRRGFINGYKELWGSQTLYLADILKQGNYSSKATFFRMMATQNKGFMRHQRKMMSKMLATGPKLSSIINRFGIAASATHPKVNGYTIKAANSTLTGESTKYLELIVTHANQFTPNQYVLLSRVGTAGSPANSVARSVRVNARVVSKGYLDKNHFADVVSDTTHFTTDTAARTRFKQLYPDAGVIRVVKVKTSTNDFLASTGSGATLNERDQTYDGIYMPSRNNADSSGIDGVSHAVDETAYFQSIAGILRPDSQAATAGPNDVLWGFRKREEAFMQAIEVPGNSIGTGDADADIIEAIFTGLSIITSKEENIKNLEVIMNVAWWSKCIQLIQSEKTAFKVAPNTTNVTQYGWNTIKVQGPDRMGSGILLTGIQELNDNEIYLVNWERFQFLTNQLFEWVESPSPDKNKWVTIRDTTGGKGYQYIRDCITFGDLVCTEPCANAIITNLPRPRLNKAKDVVSR